MKKILPNNSLKNKTLRERKDLSPLLKTYCHRYHYQSDKIFKKWMEMLTFKEKEKIYKYYGGDMDSSIEKITCPAIWYKDIPLKKVINGVLPKNCDKGLVVLGYRHGQCMWTMGSLTGLRSVSNAPDGVGEYVQGFLTNKNRFVDRTEGANIALGCGQIKKLNYSSKELYSEDLY
jgi:hypothetical protein